MDWTLVVILSALVLLLAVLRGAQSLRHTKDSERGSLPGKGDHIIHSDYSSGGGGGGHATSYTIPKDPQEYAKRFVPREKPRKGTQK
ncbi:hypothetical protein E4Z66_01965 [Aliishimia ponticola]|uniref:Uncharacterized protein n=1 Tax=Aliishimia ponticola TaxID=2499833 RepID=A0A4S4NJE2_9RHOB|nr:hypothetical protein [Aliishimia ponticola]THH38361.1 hypothetical protein E4Z66_01965 [Aliishimia ponticola]